MPNTMDKTHFLTYSFNFVPQLNYADKHHTGTSLTLAGMMYMRWSKSGKLMPAGLICALSTASFIRNVIVYNQYLTLPARPQ